MSTTFFRSLILIAATGAILASEGDATAGEKYRANMLNNGRGVRSVSAPRVEAATSRAVVQVHGVARVGRGDTVQIGRTAVRVTPRTAIQSVASEHADAALRPRTLSGRTVTVFGRPDRTGKILEASLVIVTTEAHEREVLRTKVARGSDESLYTIPGAAEGCGELRSGAPE